MPTTVRAAAEGMPSITRRKALAVTGRALAASLAATALPPAAAALEAPVADGASPILAALIDAHQRAHANFNKAIDQREEVEAAYFEANPREVLVKLSIGGAQALYVHHDDLEERAAICREEIRQRYKSEVRLHAIRCAAPALCEKIEATLSRKLASDLRRLRKMVVAERARRDAFGLTAAYAAYDETSDAETAAGAAVLAYHCTTLAEIRQRMDYLRGADGNRSGSAIYQSIDGIQGYIDALLGVDLLKGGAA